MSNFDYEPLDEFTPAPRWPLPGTTIRSARCDTDFIIGQHINDGNFSRVFECTDAWQNNLVAKVLKPDQITPDVLIEKAINEVGALELLRHPNVVYVHDAFRYDGLVYIIVERCDEDIKGIIEDSRFDGRVWFRPVAQAVLQALQFVHVNNMVHCDVHPGNVLWKQHRDLFTTEAVNSISFKLSDVGIAKRVGEVVETGTFLNTIRPPECLDAQEFGTIDYRVDIYQTGLLFLQILTGTILSFSIQERLNGEPRRLALSLPPPYSSIVEKMLRRHVDYRPISTLQIWKQIEQIPNTAVLR